MDHLDASQKRPVGEVTATERLHTMSPRELAEALEETLEHMTEETYDPALIDAYLDALDEKAPMPEAPDPQAAFQAFTQALQNGPQAPEANQPQGNSSPAPVKGRSLRRSVVTAAITVALLLSLMVGAQAAGFNVFGNLARWTDELFFISPSMPGNADSEQYHAAFQQALEEQKLPKELAPAWYPEGFTAGEPEAFMSDGNVGVQLTFDSEDGRFFAVDVTLYDLTVGDWQFIFEKDSEDVEVYSSGGKMFYIMSNLNTYQAVWSNDGLFESIAGDLSVDEIKRIIDSIGG